MAQITVKGKWLKDKQGNHIAPKTTTSNIVNDDGTKWDDFVTVEPLGQDEVITNFNDGTIVDSLNSDDFDKALSARQGKILNENKIEVIEEEEIIDSSTSDVAITLKNIQMD